MYVGVCICVHVCVCGIEIKVVSVWSQRNRKSTTQPSHECELWAVVNFLIFGGMLTIRGEILTNLGGFEFKLEPFWIAFASRFGQRRRDAC